MKTYSTKSKAVRAAQKARINLNTIRFTHDIAAGTWTWIPKKTDEVAAQDPESFEAPIEQHDEIVDLTHDITAGTWTWVSNEAGEVAAQNPESFEAAIEQHDEIVDRTAAPATAASEEDDREIAEVLCAEQPAAEAIERVMPIAPERVIVLAPEAVLAVYNAWVEADPDAFDADAMLAYLTRAYEAGRQAAATKPPRRATERRTAEPKEARGPNKRERAAGLLTRPGGATAREILDVTGWPAVSVPALAKASRVTLRQEKDGKVTRYYGTASSD